MIPVLSPAGGIRLNRSFFVSPFWASEKSTAWGVLRHPSGRLSVSLPETAGRLALKVMVTSLDF